MQYTRLFVGIVAALGFSLSQASSFVDDAQVSLTAKNYYFDRDYTNNTPYPAARDWAQGFVLKAQSGYSDGPVGFGIDLMGTAGINLMNNAEQYAGSGLFPVDSKTNERPNTYGELRWTAKAKLNKTTLHVGTLTPMFPVIFSTPARLFQQSFRGIHLQSNDIENLHLNALYVDRVNQRDSTNDEHIRVGNPNGRFSSSAESSGLHMLGGEYKITPQYTAQLYHATLHDIYQQNYAGLKTNHDLGWGRLLSDVRLFVSQDEGEANAGHIDNQHLSGIWGISKNNHTLSAGYMQSFGDTALPILAGGEPPVFLDCISADFTNKDEKVFSVRYDYDFKETALNGLKFMTRYSKGVDIDLPQFNRDDFEQDALDFDLNYRIPTGKFEGVNIRTRYTRYRNDMPNIGMVFRSDDETRVNVDYTWKF